MMMEGASETGGVASSVESLDSNPAAAVRTLKRDLLRLLGAVTGGADSGLPTSFASGTAQPEVEDVISHCEERSSELMRTALREALRDEEQSHAISRGRVEALELELLESRATYEVALDSEHVTNLRSAAKTRKLQSASVHADLIDEYERQVGALNCRCEVLEAKNISLELECAALAPRFDMIEDTEVAAALSSHRLSTTLASQRTAKRLEQHNSRLKAENSDLKTKLRRLAVVERVAKTQSRVASSRSTEVNRHRAALERERRLREHDRAELEMASRELNAQRERNAALVEERRDLLTKVRAFRDYVKSLPLVGLPTTFPLSSSKPKFHVSSRI